ncbi:MULTISPECIES: EAL domain-containing protein [unclassified Vibrio]|uniref:EAL domain-containing protein n=1 Tax=unclassified Vibrio TaxID=2614977 RepID=UPI0029656913|nr:MULTISPECIES: EAL domain-containing protein [unclassified Vibrio]MDW1676615.1 EAL domain-containing protein [Vibrio sp. Vb5029]MDW1984602.1 EAL domain-containing protein [Vibrio sp. 811]MDW2024068.1 EAL domain-containing protein [Vibrio sp. 397]MDW2028495.1 EAL domain-containing protein [Vibrio sp. 399]MDW2214705.1 EAL domain-containing protein [Vibrio sp. 1982]
MSSIKFNFKESVIMFSLSCIITFNLGFYISNLESEKVVSRDIANALSYKINEYFSLLGYFSRNFKVNIENSKLKEKIRNVIYDDKILLDLVTISKNGDVINNLSKFYSISSFNLFEDINTKNSFYLTYHDKNILLGDAYYSEKFGEKVIPIRAPVFNDDEVFSFISLVLSYDGLFKKYVPIDYKNNIILKNISNSNKYPFNSSCNLSWFNCFLFNLFYFNESYRYFTDFPHDFVIFIVGDLSISLVVLVGALFLFLVCFFYFIYSRYSYYFYLKGAFRNEEFYLRYQPQFSGEGVVIGIEALSRWTSPYLGDVRPDVFIKKLEQYGLMKKFGENVLHNSIKESRDLCVKNNISLSINASIEDLKNNNYSLYLKRLIDIYDFPVNLLKVEITESAEIDRLDFIKNNIFNIKRMGVRLSMDDFGSGFSSLFLLNKIKFDEIKVDKSLIDDIDFDKRANTTLININRLSMELNIDVVVEGVERYDQLKILNSIGFCRYQGFYFSKPVSLGCLELIIEDGKI